LLFILTTTTYRKTFAHGIIALIFVILYGYYKTEISKNYKHLENKNNITIVQPSIPQEDKLNLNKFRSNLEMHLSLSNISDIYNGKKLIIWPEAAINTPINEKNGLLEYISSHIKHEGIFIITGADRKDENRNIYNSFRVIGKNSKTLQIYDKRHLLPFGEFIPEFLLNLGLRKITQGALNFSSGSKTRTVKVNGFDDFDVLICYEIVFPGEILDSKNSKWILNITNDAWFKNTDGPTQHLKTTCIRAIEEGRPIVRCANNGISCIIDCNGKILKKLSTDQVDVINSHIPSDYRDTIYSKYKNNLAFIMIGIFFIVAVLLRRKTKN